MSLFPRPKSSNNPTGAFSHAKRGCLIEEDEGGMPPPRFLCRRWPPWPQRMPPTRSGCTKLPRTPSLRTNGVSIKIGPYACRVVLCPRHALCGRQPSTHTDRDTHTRAHAYRRHTLSLSLSHTHTDTLTERPHARTHSMRARTNIQTQTHVQRHTHTHTHT